MGFPRRALTTSTQVIPTNTPSSKFHYLFSRSRTETPGLCRLGDSHPLFNCRTFTHGNYQSFPDDGLSTIYKQIVETYVYHFTAPPFAHRGNVRLYKQRQIVRRLWKVLGCYLLFIVMPMAGLCEPRFPLCPHAWRGLS